MAVIQFMVDPEAAAKAASGEGGGALLPAGAYVLRVEAVTGEPPKVETGYPTLVCKCKVLWSFNGNNVGRTITRRFRMSPKAIPYFFLPFCAAAGVPVQQGTQGIQFDDAALLGATTKVECSHSRGKTRPFEDWGNDEPVQLGAPQARPAFPPGSAAPPPWAQQAVQAPQAPPWAQAHQAAQQPPHLAPPAGPMAGAPTPAWQPPFAQGSAAAPAAPVTQGWPAQAPAPAANPWGQLPPRGQG